jgi:Major Facilitator Superfamily
MNTTAVSRVEHDGIDPRVWKITGVVALAPLMTSLDSTVVNVSLSTLGQELRVPLTTIQWVVTGYLLALALMLPLSGWLVDRVGAKRLYLGCFAAFTCASLLCGVSTTAATLIGSRILQGMAGGLLAPMAQMMIARQAGRHVARVMGVMVVPACFLAMDLLHQFADRHPGDFSGGMDTTEVPQEQRLGGPVATTVLAIYLHARMTLESHHDALAQSASLARAFAATFRLLCLIHVAVVVAASRLPLWAHQHDQTGDYDAEQAMEVLTE